MEITWFILGFITSLTLTFVFAIWYAKKYPSKVSRGVHKFELENEEKEVEKIRNKVKQYIHGTYK